MIERGTTVAECPIGSVAAPEPSEVAREMFGAAFSIARRYADLLASEGVLRGLIGPREVPRLWDRHLVNCGRLAGELAAGDRVADVGSGAGLPGVVIAILRPDVELTLIEPLLRRSVFLEEVVDSLGLTHVTVRRARAELCTDLVGSLDSVLARAVAPLDRLAGWTVPLLRPGGRVLALKGASAADELAAARPALLRLGVSTARIRSVGPPASTATVVEIVAGPQRARPGGGAAGAGSRS